MTIHRTKRAVASALTIAALTCAGTAHADSDYLLKIESIPGESSNIVAGPGAGPHVKKTSGIKYVGGGGKAQGQTAHKSREKWIELMSVQFGAERTATGGASVIADNEIHSPRDASSGLPNREASAPSLSERTLSASNTEMAGLLLPAVQKIREAAARMTPWTGCASGQKIDPITIKQKSTGQEGKILDPVVTSCATESVSFSFTKIEWN